MEAVARSGTRYWRVNFGCTQSLASDDTIMRLAWEHGLTVIADLVTNCSGSREYPTKAEYSAKGSPWETWLYEIVNHYGAGGSFWSGKANPTPIQIFEVWNEPNRAINNPGGGLKAQPGNFSEFLERTDNVLHTASGSAEITCLMGGLLTISTKTVTEFGKPRENMSVHDFLQGIGEKGTGQGYDGMGIHPYAFAAGEEVKKVAENVNTARANLDEIPGGSLKSLWITEIGWPVKNGDAAHPVVSKERQAELIGELVARVKGKQEADHIRSLVYYNYRDFSVGSWEGFCGLRELPETKGGIAVGTFRPSWSAFQGATGAAHWPVSPEVGAGTATTVRNEEAIVEAPVDPKGLTSTVEVEYGTTAGYGSTVVVQGSEPLYSEADHPVSQALPGLAAATVYHYRFVAINENEERSDGPDSNFTTTAASPIPRGLPDTGLEEVIQGLPQLEGINYWWNAPFDTTNYSYQWERCAGSASTCTQITGATSRTYTPTAADVGDRLAVTASAVNEYGTGTAQSELSAPVQASGQITQLELPAGSRPTALAGQDNGSLWFANGTELGLVSREGVISERSVEASGPITDLASSTFWMDGGDYVCWLVGASDQYGCRESDGAQFTHTMSGDSTTGLAVRTPNGEDQVTVLSDDHAKDRGEVCVFPGVYQQLECSAFDGLPGKVVARETSSQLWEMTYESREEPGHGGLKAFSYPGVFNGFSVTHGIPGAVANDASGGEWWTYRDGSESGLGHFSGLKRAVREYVPFPAGEAPTELLEGEDGYVWFVMPSADKVGYATPGGELHYFSLPAGSEPTDLAQTGSFSGIKRGVWVSEPGIGKLALITG
jgi:streptogramin lyase